MALQKLVCNVDETLLEEVDMYASDLHVTRTAAVSALLSQALKLEKVAQAAREKEVTEGA